MAAMKLLIANKNAKQLDKNSKNAKKLIEEGRAIMERLMNR